MFRENALSSGINQGLEPEVLEVEQPDLSALPEQPLADPYSRLTTPRTNIASLTDANKDYDIGVGSALWGAARQSDTASIARGLYYDTIDNVNRFGEDDPDFSLEQALQDEGMALTVNEMEQLTSNKPRNQASFDYYIEDIQNKRTDYTAMANYPKTVFAAGMFDPIYLVGGGVGAVAGRSVQAGRLASGAIAGGIDTTIAASAAYYNPDLTTMDVVANGVLGFGFGAVFGGTPKSPVDVPVRPANVTGTLKAPSKPDADLLEQLRANVGGYHDGSVPEWTVKDGKQVVEGVPYDFRDIDVNFGNSHVGGKPEVQFETTMDGQVQPRFTGDVELDTPTALRDISGIRTEQAKLNGEPGFKDWTFLRKDWASEGVDTIPKFKDIDWETKNSRSIPIKNTALKAMYDIVETRGIPDTIRTEAMRQITMGGKHLSEVSYSFRNVKGSSATKRTLGTYDPSTDSIKVRKYGDIKADPRHTTLHEAMHALTYAKVEQGKLNPNSTHGKIVKEMDELRTYIKEALETNPEYKKVMASLSKEDKFAIDYSLTSTHELLSHLSEISAPRLKQWRELLDKMELPEHLRRDPFTPNASNMLTALIDSLRKLLGLNVKDGNALAKALRLQDDLLQTPSVDIVMPNGSVDSIVLGTAQGANQILKTGIEEAKQSVKDAGSVMGAVGNKLAWNFYKTAHGINSKFADTFLNDPLGTNPGNIQQLKNGYRTDFIDKYRTVWESTTLQELKNMGITWSDMMFNPSKTRQAHNQISKDVYEAMIQIERGTYNPEAMGLSKNLQDIVKTMDDFGKDAARLLVDKELLPPSILDSRGGYFPRRWDGNSIDKIIQGLEKEFSTASKPYESAKHFLGEQLGNSLRYPGLDSKARKLYGTALIQRALNQADNVDLVFRGHMGNETAVFFRQELEKLTGDSKTIQRIMDVVTGKIDDAGLDRWQKQRMDLDMGHVMVMPDGTTLKVSDLLDTNNILQNMSRYLEDVSGKSAMADHGIKTTTDLHLWEQSFMRSATKGGMDKTKAGEMYEDVINNILGRPSGRTQHIAARIIGGLTQMTALRGSGFWQVTELAKAYARAATTQGIGSATGTLFKAFGDYKAVKDPRVARQLDHILARKSFNEVRTRPYVDMFQDGFANNSSRMSAFEHAKGMVYHLNGMTTVQRFQSIYSAKVLTTSLEDAVRGNTKLKHLFTKHGLDEPTQARVRGELDKHGLDVDNWDAEVWSKVNPVMTSLMDTYVLRSSTGDVPYFFQFSEAGKIVGTFQNFVLTSHNRIMANTMVNEGAKGFALLTAMQLPLAMLMTQVSSVSGGRGLIEDQSDWIAASLGQMGSFGLIVELFNLITGNSNGIGGAFTISVDRGMDVFGKALQGDFGGALEAGAKSAPLLSLMPGWGLGIKTITDLGGE